MSDTIDYASFLAPIAEATDSDIYLFSAPVDTYQADRFISLLRYHADKRANCTLILTTSGGSPDAGYRMVRAIRRYYRHFYLLVFGVCKSTGTLIALGADGIAMGDFGEFGPLDIQLAKEDEIFQTSGLNYAQSLQSLQEQLFQHFYSHLLELRRVKGVNMPLRTASDVAAKLALGLLTPISSQLDPVKLGEVHRAVTIADEYGKRLNSKKDLPSRLIVGYPSHSFVIDIREAQAVFGKEVVRSLNDIEMDLEEVILPQTRHELAEPLVLDLTAAYLQAEISAVEEPAAPELDSSQQTLASHATPEQQPADQAAA